MHPGPKVLSANAAALRKAARAVRRACGQLGRFFQHRGLAPETLVFGCNICGSRSAIALSALQREHALCSACGSNMRFRAVVHHLSCELFGKPLSIGAFPSEAAQMVGLGMSDAHMYAERLEKRMRYTNTFFHREPRLDILAPDPVALGTCDFVISSDVLEHVAPPVERAIVNLRRLLKPGGLLVLTVPFHVEGATIEHFPELHAYAIEDRGGTAVLVNTTADGRRQEFPDLVFHGGPGSTLEMRRFSQSGLRGHLEQAGFTQIRFHAEPYLGAGVYWSNPSSVPVTARAG